MSNSKELKVFRPFGPAIAEVEVEESFVKNLNDYTNIIISDNEKSFKLISSELISSTVTAFAYPTPFNNFFDPFDDPFDNFFDRNNDDFYEVEADAFLSLTTDKKSVYVGEGFNTTLAFYVSESNVADMRFYELGRQLTEILKKIKPGNCWEENFNIENINPKTYNIIISHIGYQPKTLFNIIVK